MGMTREEVLVKLNMDASQLDEQTKRSLSNLAEGAKEHHKWWQHAGSSGREYHKILQQIGEMSPGLEAGVKLFINPLVGGLAAAGLGIGYLIERFKAWKEAAREAAEAAKASFERAFDLTGGASDRRRSV